MEMTDTTSGTFIKRLARVGLPTLFVWVLVFEWIARAHPGIQITTRILYLMLAGMWLIQRWRQGGSLRITSVGALLLLYFLYTALLVTKAPLPFHSLEIELSYVFYFLVFLFYLNDVRSRSSRTAWHFAFLQAAIIFSLFNLFLVVRWWREWLQISGTVFRLPPFGYRLPGLFLQHPNVEAAYLNLILPFLVYWILISPSKKKIFGLSSLVILFLITSFFASSRGAWLATASSIGVVIILVYWKQITRYLKKQAGQRRIRISPKSIAVILIGIMATVGIGLLSYQQARFGGHGGRLGIWTIAWEIFKDAPLIGHGPGSFHVLSAVEAGIPPGFYLVHAHNIVLQILGETGLIGLLIFIALGLSVTRLIVSTWANDHRDADKLIPYISVLVGMLTHQVVDFAFEAPLYSVGVMFVLAQIGSEERSSAYTLSKQIVNIGLPLLLMIVYTAGNLITLRGVGDQYDGVLAALDGRWEDATTLLCRARDKNSPMSLYHFQCGFASAVTSTFGADEQALQEASQAYSDGMGNDPFWPYHQAAQAAILWSRGHHLEALNLMLEAHTQAPRSALLALNLGYMYANLDQVEQSQRYVALAFDLNPWFWRSAKEPWKPPGDALDAQNLEHNKTKLSLSGYHAWKGWLLIDSDELNDASDQFESALAYDPLNVDAASGLAYLALVEGNLSEADRLIHIVELTGRSSWVMEEVKGYIAAQKGELDIAYQQWISATRIWLWTSSSGPYYKSVYRRAYIPIDVPPQMVQPALPPMLTDGFQQALNEGSDLIRAEATKLLPWFENQIHLQSE
jgi:O-antigen ligase/tetratricopeptide (TPR) repeat protein